MSLEGQFLPLVYYNREAALFHLHTCSLRLLGTVSKERSKEEQVDLAAAQHMQIGLLDNTSP